MISAIDLRGKLFASYACATIVLVLGLATFFLVAAMDDALAEANRARRIVRGSLEVEVLLLAAESSQRGFLLTGEDRYLAPYREAVPSLGERIAEVRELVEPGSPAVPPIGALEENARAKVAELDRTLNAYRSGGDALQLVRTGEGQRLTDAIRDSVTEVLSVYQTERVESEARIHLFRSYLAWLIGAGNIVAFTLAAFVNGWISQAVEQLRRANEDLAASARELEAQARMLASKEQRVAAQLEEQRLLGVRLAASNEALRVSNTDLEQFAYVASHDLRAPLRGIANISEWLEDDLGASVTPPVKRHLEALRGRVRRLEALISGIAAYSRAGRAEETVETIDVGRLVRQCVDLLAAPPSVNVAIGPMPTIVAPRTPLQQIFLNLLSNAVKHGAPNGGTIEVRADEEPSRWRFSISDRGPGIAPEYHERIFALFQTLAPRDKVEGTGIGLAVVKKLIDRYGGEIRVESRKGEGATFQFTWPKAGGPR